MEWTDTIMLDEEACGSGGGVCPATEFTRVMQVQGVALLCATTTNRTELSAALELLRGFKASGRRMVLCDTTPLVVGRQLGHEVVDRGDAKVLVSCGISGREVGIGARDAGLDLSSVVVCSKPLAGGQVLVNLLVPGDVVLLVGIEESTCNEIADLLDRRLSYGSAMAA